MPISNTVQVVYTKYSTEYSTDITNLPQYLYFYSYGVLYLYSIILSVRDGVDRGRQGGCIAIQKVPGQIGTPPHAITEPLS